MTGIAWPGRLARREWLRAIIGGLAGGVLHAAHNSARAEAPPVLVTIDNFAFVPASITVRPGSVVTWTNRDDIPHVVLFQAPKLRSPVLDTAESFRHRFDQPGRYDYFCALHPHMQGRVVVAA